MLVDKRLTFKFTVSIDGDVQDDFSISVPFMMMDKKDRERVLRQTLQGVKQILSDAEFEWGAGVDANT